jgi:hypothetical protein
MERHPPRAWAAASLAERAPGISAAGRRRREDGAPSGWDRYVQ